MKRVLKASGLAPMLATAALMAGVMVAGAAPAQAQEEPGGAEFRATTLNLFGEGEVQAKPDQALINVGVRTEAPTAAEALAQNRTQMNAAIAALRAQGVKETDIQTANLNLEPQYFDDGKAPRRLTGYQAGNVVSVRLHDLKRVGQVIDALVAAGANQIDSISFELADRTAAENAARLDAVKAMQAKAELYAQASGYHLQRLVRLSENSEGFLQPVAQFAARKFSVGSTPVEGGELTVRVRVSGVYELAR